MLALRSSASQTRASSAPRDTRDKVGVEKVEVGVEVGVGGMLSSGAPPVAGLYTHVTGYLLLGAIQSTTHTSSTTTTNPSEKPPTMPPTKTPSNSNVNTGSGSSVIPDPVLTKISLYKPDVVVFEEGMRYLRTELAIASGIIPNPLTGDLTGHPPCLSLIY